MIGRHFELDLLEAVAEVDDDALISALDEAEHARLLKGPSGRQDVTWRFAHQLICQTLTDTIQATGASGCICESRARWSGSTQRRASIPPRSRTTCTAPAAWRMRARTARALMTAGDAAYAMYATEEAVQHYRRALEVLQDAGGDEATRLGVEERLADLLALLGDRAAAMEHYQTLAGVHEAHGHRVDQARIARKIGTLHWQAGDRGQAMACYQRALQTLEGN